MSNFYCIVLLKYMIKFHLPFIATVLVGICKGNFSCFAHVILEILQQIKKKHFN